MENSEGEGLPDIPRGREIPRDAPSQNTKKPRNPRSQLVVALSNCEFVKDFNYFITVQLDDDGDKVRASFMD